MSKSSSSAWGAASHETRGRACVLGPDRSQHPAVSAPAPVAEISPAPSGPPVGFWALVRESLAGSRRDLTAEPLNRAILLLAVPMVLEMVMESIFAVSDIFWVSKLGPDAVSVGVCTESLMTIIYTLAMGLAMGTGALVARRTGAKDPAGAARA